MTHEAQEYEFSPEEQKLIKAQFEEWNRLIENEGHETGDDEDSFLDLIGGFWVERETDQRSYFDSEEVIVARLKEGVALEDYIFLESQYHPIKTKSGEKWINITVNPKDVYAPKIIRYEKSYFIEQHNLYISNQGRAFEDSNYWDFAGMGTLRKAKIIAESWPMERVDIPPHEGSDSEPFAPIKGSSLGRLDFILAQKRSGNTTT